MSPESSLDPEQAAQLREAAEEMAAKLPEGDRVEFVAHYLEVMVPLNERLNEENGRLEADVLPILIGMLSPGKVQRALNVQTEFVRKTVSAILSETADVKPFAIRRRVLEAVVETLKSGIAATERDYVLGDSDRRSVI